MWSASKRNQRLRAGSVSTPRRTNNPGPPVGSGALRADQALRNREEHQEQMRATLELQHLARAGQPPKPGLVDRIRALFRRT